MEEKDLNIWNTLGIKKKTILSASDILDIGKTKSQKRSTEQSLYRVKYENKKVSASEFWRINFLKINVFKEFCLKYIYKNSVKDSKYIELFKHINFTIMNCFSSLNIINLKMDTKSAINYFSFDIAHLTTNLKMNNNDLTLFDELINEMSYKPLINYLEKYTEINLETELTYINEKLKKDYNKNNIKISCISESTFRTYLSKWRNNKEDPSLLHILHFIELANNKETKIELFFQLISFRVIMHIVKGFKFNREYINLFQSKYYTFSEHFSLIGNDDIKKEVFLKNNMFFYINDREKKESKKCKLLSFNDKDTEILCKLFNEKKYESFFDHVKYKKYKNPLDDVESKIDISLLQFIISIKLNNKKLIKHTFKNLSKIRILDYRGLKYNEKVCLSLLDGNDDLNSCIDIVNTYIEKNIENVDF